MSRDTNINDLQPWLQAYVDRLSPVERRKLGRKIATTLARENRKRMTAQESPDGQKWEARKEQPRHTDKANRKKLFLKLRGVKSLRKQVSDSRIIVGFSGNAGKIARIHHYGLKQRLKYGEAQYPERQLIGATDDDKRIAGDTVIAHIRGSE